MYKSKIVYRMPCLLSASALSTLRTNYEFRGKARECPTVNSRNGFYLLNPSKDLVATQAEFQGWFESIHTWKVSWLCFKVF